MAIPGFRFVQNNPVLTRYLPSQGNLVQLSFQFRNVCYQKFQTKYKQNDKYVIISVIVLSLTLAVSIVACIVCRHKAKAEAKKRHFKRLINDLNATEKFSIVTPSEDEDYSD